MQTLLSSILRFIWLIFRKSRESMYLIGYTYTRTFTIMSEPTPLIPSLPLTPSPPPEDVGLGYGLDYGCKYARGDGYIYISLSLWYEKGRGNQRERGRGRGRTKNEASKREYSYWGFQRRRVILYLLFLFSS